MRLSGCRPKMANASGRATRTKPITTASTSSLDCWSQLAGVPKPLSIIAGERAAAQLVAHERVREISRTKGRITIQPVLPVDILGAYVLLPRFD